MQLFKFIMFDLLSKQHMNQAQLFYIHANITSRFPDVQLRDFGFCFLFFNIIKYFQAQFLM